MNIHCTPVMCYNTQLTLVHKRCVSIQPNYMEHFVIHILPFFSFKQKFTGLVLCVHVRKCNNLFTVIFMICSVLFHRRSTILDFGTISG